MDQGIIMHANVNINQLCCCSIWNSIVSLQLTNENLNFVSLFNDI